MFKLDSPLMVFLNKVADIMILGMVFMVACIPVFTIGASFTAAYYIGFKMVKNEEGYIIRGFFKAFKDNFKQATIMWLFVLLVLGIIVADYRIILYSGIEFARWMRISMVTVTVVAAFGAVFMFPLQARFTNSVKNTIKNAFLMALSHLPSSFLLVAVYAVPVVILYFVPQLLPAVFLLGFGSIIYFKSFILLKVFKRYEGALEEDEAGDASDGKTDADVAEEEIAEESLFEKSEKADK